MKKKVLVLGSACALVLVLSMYSFGQYTLPGVPSDDFGSGKTCNGSTNCPSGKSAKRNSSGDISGCCTNSTPDMTGHYHS
ncbi:hypothetical protein DSECCO2_608170 [anaerobic digester metagenome]|nr:hypothetical protein [Tenuifilaceae bacterium]